MVVKKCCLCSKHIRECSGKYARNITEPYLAERLKFYFAGTTAGIVNPTTIFMCRTCDGNVYAYCKKAGFIPSTDVVPRRRKSTELSQLLEHQPQPSSRFRISRHNVTQENVEFEIQAQEKNSAARPYRSRPQHKNRPQTAPTEYGNDNDLNGNKPTSPQAGPSRRCNENQRQQMPQSSVKPCQIPSNGIEALDNDPEETNCSPSKKCNDVSDENALNSTTGTEETPIQAEAQYSQCVDSQTGHECKRIKLDTVLTVPFSESRCFICKNKCRQHVSYEAKVHLFREHEIFIRSGQRSCSEHLAFNEKRFTAEAIEIIKRISTKGPNVDSKEITHWLKTLSKVPNCARSCLDFDSPDIPEETYKSLLGVSKEEFDDILSHIEGYLRRSKHSSPRNRLAIFMIKLKLGIPQAAIACLFGIQNQPLISQAIHTVAKLLAKHFVPLYLGPKRISRQKIRTKHTSNFAASLYDIPSNNILLVADATYIYTQKATNHETQAKTYSGHKKRNLVKFMLIVASDGQIVECSGPWPTDSLHNDAGIFNCMLADPKFQEFQAYLQPGDHILLDRGFKMSRATLNRNEVTASLPAFLLKTAQFSTPDGNLTRKVTMVRYVVESANGRIKNKFGFFQEVIPLPYMSILGDMFKVACAIVNKFGKPLFTQTEKHDMILKKVEERLDLANALADRVNAEGSHLKKNKGFLKVGEEKLDDFPKLTEQDLLEITLGPFQIHSADAYNINHLDRNPKYELKILRDEPGIVRARLQSRFKRYMSHDLWIQFCPGQNGAEAISGYYCECSVGRRTLGTCSHVTAVLKYLGKDRHEAPHQIRVPYHHYMLDAAEHSIEDFDNIMDEVIVSHSQIEDNPSTQGNTQQ